MPEFTHLKELADYGIIGAAFIAILWWNQKNYRDVISGLLSSADAMKSSAEALTRMNEKIDAIDRRIK